jgi:hypothetical protein
MLDIDAQIADALKDQNFPSGDQLTVGKMIWTGTEEEYESIDNPDPQTLYFIISSGTGSGSVASS